MQKQEVRVKLRHEQIQKERPKSAMKPKSNGKQESLLKQKGGAKTAKSNQPQLVIKQKMSVNLKHGPATKQKTDVESSSSCKRRPESLKCKTGLKTFVQMLHRPVSLCKLFTSKQVLTISFLYFS